jgi:hypothetical protein
VLSGPRHTVTPDFWSELQLDVEKSATHIARSFLQS